MVRHAKTSLKRSEKIFAEINADTTLKKISLENEEFLENVPDGGGELTGFFKGGFDCQDL
jgi:hypothetical protein